MNVEYFPYDEQICFMKFGSWTYNGAQVDLKHLDQVSQTAFRLGYSRRMQICFALQCTKCNLCGQQLRGLGWRKYMLRNKLPSLAWAPGWLRVICIYICLCVSVYAFHVQVPGSNLVQVGIDLSEFYLSVEWDILEVPATKNEEYYPDTLEPFSGELHKSLLLFLFFIFFSLFLFCGWPL